MIQDKIRELVQYGLLTGLVSAEDEIYTTNRLLELFQIEDYPYGFGEKIEQTEEEAVKRLPDLLTEMMDYAVENGILQEDGIVYRDLFDTKIMSCLVGRPSEIIRRFHEEYEKSPEAATNFFYKFSQDTDYIRRYRVCRDEKFCFPSLSSRGRSFSKTRIPNSCATFTTLLPTFPTPMMPIVASDKLIPFDSCSKIKDECRY